MKAEVTLGGIQVAATAGVQWRLVTGVQPYTTVLTFHSSAKDRVASMLGQAVTLVIKDARGVKTEIKSVYVMQQAPSDSPHRVSFVVADRRWLWRNKLIARDFNVLRKTGSRTVLQDVPIETSVIVDQYDYLPYSLNAGHRWTPRQAVEHVLELLEGKTHSFKILGWPLKDAGRGDSGEFTLQGVTLRDQGDMAMARLLSYIPGAEVYVNTDGDVCVFDATDLGAAEQYYQTLPPAQWGGEAAAWVDRKKIRPKSVIAHYQREVELLLEYSDDYSGGTAVQPGRNDPYCDNVIPTVDRATTITEYDPQTNSTRERTVPAGTWVTMAAFLRYADGVRSSTSLPWTFDTIATYWQVGSLDAVLGAQGLDLDPNSSTALRIQAVKQHFRQTFRINRRYMERVRDIRAVRVGLLDPLTGARAPSPVWGQACVMPSNKGWMTSTNGDPTRFGCMINLDSYPALGNVTGFIPGPAEVRIVDPELGIFRIEWIADPYGMTGDVFVPCNLVGATGARTVATRDLSQQDTHPMGVGMQRESGTNGLFLSKTMKFKAMVTIVPAAPNNETQFHRETVEAITAAGVFSRGYRIQDGEGPPMEVFVPPGEVTARFAWANDTIARQTLVKLLGLYDDPSTPRDESADPNTAGVDTLPGFKFCNEARHITNHAISVAAEVLTNYADNVQGSVLTVVPGSGVKLVGNMGGAAIRVSAAPSAKVDVVHSFPGQSPPLSRMAVMPEMTRRIVLGTLPFK